MKLSALVLSSPAWTLALLLALAASHARAAEAYRAGQVVEDFSLINRATGQPMKLSDFEGKIVLFDWFAWWCPFCQAAAPQLLEGLDRYYEAQGGNPDGIPFVHVGVNLQRAQEAQTQNFVNRAGLELVLEDFNRTVANRFASGGQPIFAIINGVANSPSHKPWELLYSQLGYGQTTFPVAAFRAAIDAVRKPANLPGPMPVTLTNVTRAADGALEFTFDSKPERRYRIETSSNLQTWAGHSSILAASASTLFRDPEASASSPRFYRIVSE